MITVVQRVRRARVRVDDRVVGAIGSGLTALVAVIQGDSDRDVGLTARKLVQLRIFYDADGRMNLSLQDVGGAALIVSQFTLAADTRRGRRPSFSDAAPPDAARERFDALVERVAGHGVEVASGEFGAMMEVELVNDGPVTLILDSRETRRGGRRRPDSDGDRS